MSSGANDSRRRVLHGALIVHAEGVGHQGFLRRSGAQRNLSTPLPLPATRPGKRATPLPLPATGSGEWVHSLAVPAARPGDRTTASAVLLSRHGRRGSSAPAPTRRRGVRGTSFPVPVRRHGKSSDGTPVPATRCGSRLSRIPGPLRRQGVRSKPWIEGGENRATDGNRMRPLTRGLLRFYMREAAWFAPVAFLGNPTGSRARDVDIVGPWRRRGRQATSRTGRQARLPCCNRRRIGW